MQNESWSICLSGDIFLLIPIKRRVFLVLVFHFVLFCFNVVAAVLGFLLLMKL